MEKTTLGKKCGLFNPGLAFLTTGLLLLAPAGMMAADLLPAANGLKVESVNQKGRTVTVTVRDAHGELIGANVIVKGTTIGNVTDMNGRVVLNDIPANAVLEISYIGYEPQVVAVKNQTHVNVVLSEDSKALQEVVVVGYGTMEKKQVTSAITSLKADDLMVGVGGADISTALQGRSEVW